MRANLGKVWIVTVLLIGLTGILLRGSGLGSFALLLYIVGFFFFFFSGIALEYSVWISEKELIIKVPFNQEGHILPWSKIAKVTTPRGDSRSFLFMGEGLKLRWSGYRMVQKPEELVAALRKYLKPDVYAEAGPLLDEIELQAKMRIAEDGR